MRLGVAAAAFLIASPAWAQATPTPTPGWSSDAFLPAERGSRWFYVESLDLRGHGRMALGAVGTYSYRSVAIRDGNGDDVRGSLVRNQAVLHTGASFVFADRIRLGFDVPLQIAADGRSVTLAGALYTPAASVALVYTLF